MPLKVTREVDETKLLAAAQQAANQPPEEEEPTLEELEAQAEAAEEGDEPGAPGAEEAPETKGADDFSPAQQKRLQAVIDRTLAVERRRRERDYKKMFGTADLKQIAEVYMAGQVVAAASGRSPKDLVAYVQEKQKGTPAASGVPQLASLEAELAELRNLIAGKQGEESRERELKEAKQEFGTLFDEFQVDIEDKADELGISILDAAAMVLRPHLRKVAEQKVVARQKSVRERRVASTNEGGAAAGLNLEDLLTPTQKLVARKMGVSFKEYAQQLREVGKEERR